MNASKPWTQRVYDHPLLDGAALNFFAEELNPDWSLLEPRARVLAVREETHDTRSFVLKPGWGWSRMQAGQHVGVSVEIDGVRYQRRYSVSSLVPARRRGSFTITVKRVPGGRVSNYLHDHVKAGDRLTLQAPAGDFLLPAVPASNLLMLAGGSGITPIMAQLRQLLHQGYAGDIELLCYVRSARDHIFAEALLTLARQYPQLQVSWCEEQPNGERFSPQQLAHRVPDYRQRQTLLCGPAGMMAAVRQHWQDIGCSDQLSFEYFGAPQALSASSDATTRIHLQRSQRQIDSAAGQAALLALEAAGETPAYGCRMGICQSCKCTKLSGRVRNLVSGQISQEPNQQIQLCISAAESDLVLDY